VVHSRAVPSGAGAFGLQRSAPRQADPPRKSEERPTSARQLYDGSDRPDSDSLQRRRSRGRSLVSASTPSAAGSGAECCPVALAVVAYPGWRSPRCSCVPCRRRGHGPTPAIAEAGGSAPERMGESDAAVEAAGGSGAAPETTGLKRTAPEPVSSKRVAPQQGMSDRLVMKARVRSKM
jgi:hypothetical protein